MSGLTGCAFGKKVVILPDSHQLVDLKDGCEPMPGFVGISAVWLDDIFEICGIEEAR